MVRVRREAARKAEAPKAAVTTHYPFLLSRATLYYTGV